ncbi:MFS transporter [Streptosporangium carneum]|uniref:MFS transporter n=1 Tax=Streptosporangium carneum TaxID=47481 RepID=A0A9W6I354_9ACTN|nr:MFS transporter [Streptosporangium carneum]GLK11177.1 MFS transporter [Streptosporangium carneum]
MAADDDDDESVPSMLDMMLIGVVIEVFCLAVYILFFEHALGGDQTLRDLLFPSGTTDSLAGATALVYWIGYPVGLLGGVCFGHLADRAGRKPAVLAGLAVTSTIVVLTALLFGSEPGDGRAVVLTVVLRVALGFTLGVKPVTVLLPAFEYAEPEAKVMGGGMLFIVGLFGLMFSAMFADADHVIGNDENLASAWGWQGSLLVMAALTLAAGLFLWWALKETPDFQQAQADEEKPVGPPIVELLRTSWRSVLLGIGGLSFGVGGFQAVSVFLLDAMESEAMEPVAVRAVIIAGVLGFMIGALFGGVAAIEAGARRVAVTGVVGASVLAVSASVLGSGSLSSVGLWLMLLALPFVVAVNVAMIPLLAEAFPTRVRATGMSVVYAGAAIVFAGLLPQLVNGFHGIGTGSWSATVMFAVPCLLSLLCLRAEPFDE